MKKRVLSNCINRFLDKFRGDGNPEERATSSDQLTNKRLLEELTIHFKTMLETESVGNRMLYPMSFNILMTPDDYKSRKQSLPFVLPEVIASFYGVIESKKSVYPNYTPPAQYWYFQFSACQMKEVQVGDSAPMLVRPGHLTTVASLLTFDIMGVDNVSVDNNPRVSIKLDNSQVMNDVNVNWNAIKNLDILSEGTFKYPFDMSLGQDTTKIADKLNVADGGDGLAELSYSRGGRNYHFTMKDNLIHISGKNEMRKGRAFFCLESTEIKDSHVQIKYLPEEKKFQIAAYGPARLNSRELKESSGGTLYWHDLANNSSIFINDEISVRFKIK